MVGRATAKKLRGRAIKTIGDLAQTDLVWNYANGNDSSLVRENRRPMIKGIGNSTTIPFDVEDATTAHLVLLSLTETVAARLRQTEYCARLVSVSLRTNEFYSCSHKEKLPLRSIVPMLSMRLLANSLTSYGKGSRYGILEFVYLNYAKIILRSLLFSRRIMKNRELWIERSIRCENDLVRMPFFVHRS